MIYEHEFTISGKPKGKDRPRFSRGHVFTPKATTDYEKIVRETYYQSGGKPIPPQTPISISIIAYMPIPKADKKAIRAKKLDNKIPCFKKPDVDNVAKIIMDGLQGSNAPIDDDCEVIYVSAQKRWSDDPRVKVKVHAMMGE